MNRTWLAVVALAFSTAFLFAQAPTPPASLALGARQSKATPVRSGFTHTGGGNIDVQQPSADALVVTMTGVAVAGPHPCQGSTAGLLFELDQDFVVSFDKPEVKKAKFQLEGRLIGLLRSHARGGGSAEVSQVCASVRAGELSLLALTLPSHAVAGGESLSINDRAAPVSVEVRPGAFCLHQTFHVAAAHDKGLLGKAASAEFAPDPALDPLWISAFEPFRGANKKEFGLQITLRVIADEVKAGR